MSNNTCSVEDCNREVRVISRGLCSGHYQQARAEKTLKPLKRRVLERDADGNKRCTRCKEWKPEQAFASSSGKVDGLQSHCRACRSEQYRKNAVAVRDKMREQRFGISRAEFDALFKSQGNLCAICRGDNPGTNYWSVDHDHACCPQMDKTCGKCIRGILCVRCNHALGHARDSVEILSSMITYLGDYAKRKPA